MRLKAGRPIGGKFDARIKELRLEKKGVHYIWKTLKAEGMNTSRRNVAYRIQIIDVEIEKENGTNILSDEHVEQ